MPDRGISPAEDHQKKIGLHCNKSTKCQFKVIIIKCAIMCEDIVLEPKIKWIDGYHTVLQLVV